jgi:hypothetical protein
MPASEPHQGAGEAAGHQGDHGPVDGGFVVGGEAFVVLAGLLDVHIQAAVNWASHTAATGPPTSPNG